ncbi:MAG: hypothetical protein NTAFB09_07370 [Nitrosospira sp.]
MSRQAHTRGRIHDVRVRKPKMFEYASRVRNKINENSDRIQWCMRIPVQTGQPFQSKLDTDCNATLASPQIAQQSVDDEENDGESNQPQ